MSGPARDFKDILALIADGRALSAEDSEAAFDLLMSGQATPAQTGGFLMALRLRGETVDEITGAVRAMRAKAEPVKAPEGAIDIVGTGGDAAGTYNISTGAAIVVAACGVPVAKHGNRALSSKSGSADVLRELGVNLDAPFELVARAMREAGIGFMMAPRHHTAMKHVAAARGELGVRTIFNLLGPLTNPAGVKRQFTGVFARKWIEPLARVLGNLGTQKAWIVHGEDGLDEMTTTGISYVAALENGHVTTFQVTPEEAGLERVSLDDLRGGTPVFNAAAVKDLLAGTAGPYRDAVLYNAAGALIVADRAETLKEGVALAARAIDDGKARATLDKLVEITNSSLPKELLDEVGG
ncbi:MAG: anthranilate phosphoribosyltransferase [Rhodospirillales bacterium]